MTPIEKVSLESVGENVYGLTFDIDTVELEELYGISRQTAYAQIEKVLTELGFTHVQYSVYFALESQTDGAFIVKVAKAFASLEFAPVIRNLHGFEIKNWSDLTEEVKDLHRLIKN